MKLNKLFFIILFAIFALFAVGCNDESESAPIVQAIQAQEVEPEPETTEPGDTEDPATDDPTTDTPTDPTTDEPSAEPETPIVEPVPFAFAAIGDNIRFWDGTTWANTEFTNNAGSKWYATGDLLQQLDEYGQPISEVYAPESMEIIKKTSSGFVGCDIIEPAEAYALGAMARTYSQIWEYSDSTETWSEIGAWYLNEWRCADIIETESSEVIVRNSMGSFHPLGDSAAIHAANDNGLLIRSYDAYNLRAYFDTAQGSTFEAWGTNYLSSAKDWLKFDDTYYSGNGYEYSFSGGLSEYANAMQAWRTSPYPLDLAAGEGPTIIPLCVDAGLNVIYWIEANTGWLVEHRLATDQVVMEKRLYVGDGTRLSGGSYAKTLNQILVDGTVYFSFDGSVMSLDLSSGAVGVFLAADVRLKRF